jgi:hypothetical protein
MYQKGEYFSSRLSRIVLIFSKWSVYCGGDCFYQKVGVRWSRWVWTLLKRVG